jgi:hypothetical protein
LAYDFADDAPGACPELVEGTGAGSGFNDFPRDLDIDEEVRLWHPGLHLPGEMLS